MIPDVTVTPGPELSRALTAAGLTVMHALWQGALVAAVLALWLRGARRRSAAERYGACAVALLSMLALPTLTLLALLSSPTLSLSTDRVSAAALSGLTARAQLAAPYVGAAWLTGAALLQLRLAVAWLRAAMLAHVGLGAAPDEIVRRVRTLATRLGVRAHVRVRTSAYAFAPMLVGWLRPLVLLPVDVARTLSRSQLDAVLAHELAHVRRHDYAVNVLQCFSETLLFFHPAVWWVSHRLRVEREYACDDVAVRVSGGAINYARALALLDARRDVNPALASTGGSLMDRITRLVERSPGASPRTRVWNVAAGGLAACAVVVAVGCFRASSAPEDAPRDPGGDVARSGEVTLSFGVPESADGELVNVWEADGNRAVDIDAKKAFEAQQRAENELAFGDPHHDVMVELVDPESGETSVFTLAPTGEVASGTLTPVQAQKLREIKERIAANAPFGDGALHETHDEATHDVLLERKEFPAKP